MRMRAALALVRIRAGRAVATAAKVSGAVTLSALLAATGCAESDPGPSAAAGNSGNAAGPASASAPAAGSYAAAWGPALGSQIPLLAARDNNNVPQTLESLAGERGLLLVFSRSADW